jgi:cell wall-associated NlpC family hydrolase
MTTPATLIACARTWRGVPFLHQGRSRYGIDCVGLIIETLRECAALPADYVDPRDYGRSPDGQLTELIARHCERVRVAEMGVLVLIRWPQAKLAQHVALCTGDTLIHAYQGPRGVIEHGYRGEWIKRTVALWRLPGIAYE